MGFLVDSAYLFDVSSLKLSVPCSMVSWVSGEKSADHLLRIPFMDWSISLLFQDSPTVCQKFDYNVSWCGALKSYLEFFELLGYFYSCLSRNLGSFSYYSFQIWSFLSLLFLRLLYCVYWCIQWCPTSPLGSVHIYSMSFYLFFSNLIIFSVLSLNLLSLSSACLWITLGNFSFQLYFSASECVFRFLLNFLFLNIFILFRHRFLDFIHMFL